MKFEELRIGKGLSILLGDRVLVPGNILFIEWENGTQTLAQILESTDISRDSYVIDAEAIWFEIQNLVNNQNAGVLRSGKCRAAFVAEGGEIRFARPVGADKNFTLRERRLANFQWVLVRWPNKAVSAHRVRREQRTARHYGQAFAETTWHYWLEIWHNGHLICEPITSQTKLRLCHIPKPA